MPDRASPSLACRARRLLAALAWLAGASCQAAPFEDSMAQRVLACTGCHGPQGRSGPDGYYPRIAGKPAGYLYNQLRNFRDGRRQYGPMARLLAPLSDAYLAEIAAHFAGLEVPYPPPQVSAASPAERRQAAALVTAGDAARQLPACAACHGAALTGTAPFIPGLLGLPRDYLQAQLGAWPTGNRVAQAPDCMGRIARSLSDAEARSLASWLAAQPVPTPSPAAASSALVLPLACGGVSP